MTLPAIPADARLYRRPTWFVPSPIGLPDGSVARMGNGLIWFQGYELSAFAGRDRVARVTVPVAGFADAIAPYCRDDALRHAHGAAGERASRAYSWDAINQAVVDTYLRLHATRRHATGPRQ